MRSKIYLALMSLLMVTGCVVTPRPTPTPTLTQPSPVQKQPEPSRPLVAGRISGLPGDTLFTVQPHALNGRRAGYLTQRGNGYYSIVVTSASGVDYIITAEAEGYVSTPISYTLHLDGLNAHVVEDGQVTVIEALNLDFKFTPVDVPGD